jgi:hypothetical protein
MGLFGRRKFAEPDTAADASSALAEALNGAGADPGASLKALKMLAGDPQMGMTVYCQENVFLRKAFLLGTRGILPPDSEDILQDLLDHSTTRGIPAGDIW